MVDKQIKIISIVLLLTINYSCNKKLYTEVKSDREKLSELESNEFLLISSMDIVDKLPNGIPLFYVGTKKNYHHLIYYYDGFEKITLRYKVSLSELSPQQKFEFIPDSLKSINHPIYLNEIKYQNVEKQ